MVDFKEVEFVDLPKRTGRKPTYDWDKAVSHLRSNSGRWGKIREYQKRTTANAAATFLRAKYKDIEFALRGSTIYARFGSETPRTVKARGR
jgi:hypothetical protein